MMKNMVGFYAQKKMSANVLNLQNLVGSGYAGKCGPKSVAPKIEVSKSDSLASQTKDNLFYQAFCKQNDKQNLAGKGAVAQFISAKS